MNATGRTSATVPRKIVLVTPTFHDYATSIAQAFERAGHEVVTVRYDDYVTVKDKARLKATVELPSKLRLPGDHAGRERRRVTDSVLSDLTAARPDGVVVIKGDMLDDRFWSHLDAHRVPRILWLYDDLHRHPYSPEFLAQLGPVVSYSESEAAMLREQHGVDATWVPDAFDPHRAQPTGRRVDRIAFVGAAHADRVRILQDLTDRGLPVHAWGRDFSHHPVDRLRTWGWKRPLIPASRDIPLTEAYLVVGESSASVNIHGPQTDHPMRTFEVPGMAGVSLEDRASVARFYDVGTEVEVWTDVDHLAELCERSRKDRVWSEGLREKGRARSLAEHTFDHRITEVDALWR
ncbi:glycosyltransferase [Brachybacterium sp. Marseille-Q2903]|uniref:Glycosyltransferase n=1 Tax=Brachybacterium epidermidis TaxID=2781983 RepID=A0ABR9VZ01_9MICO|nr:glycosyltransferase [Brachybacterium epidermidis]MBE9403392.1 glycosyltransferase [Brachybacterium epidermidis]